MTIRRGQPLRIVPWDSMTFAIPEDKQKEWDEWLLAAKAEDPIPDYAIRYVVIRDGAPV